MTLKAYLDHGEILKVESMTYRISLRGKFERMRHLNKLVVKKLLRGNLDKEKIHNG
jgi:hypothetical protein